MRALPRAAAAHDGGALHGCFAVREAVCGRSPQSRGERGEGNSESGGGVAGGALRLSGVAGRCVRELAARCDSAGSPAGVCGSWSGARGSRSGCVPRLAEGNAHLDFKIKKTTRAAMPSAKNFKIGNFKQKSPFSSYVDA